MRQGLNYAQKKFYGFGLLSQSLLIKRKKKESRQTLILFSLRYDTKFLAKNIWPDRQLADRHLANRHLSDWHLSDWHLSDWHLADRHLVDRHLADRHLADRHLADRHLAD